MYSDKELFHLISQEDEAAFALLMEKYWNLLYSQAIAYLKDTFKAQDLVQDVFLVIWKTRQKLHDVESPADYLFIIARNKIFNEARKRIMLPLSDTVEDYYIEKSSQPDQLLNTRNINALIQSAINQLPPQRKRVFELSRNEGLTYEAIAVRLGISRETVKVQMVKALSFLRHVIRHHITPLLFFIFFKH